MTWTASALHALHLAGSLPAYRRFRRALDDPEGAQRARLSALLRELEGTPCWKDLGPDLTYEAFRSRVPIRSYAELEASILEQRRTGSPRLCAPCARWQPTSGSTARRKWIPYPPAFLAELDAAAGPWLCDLARSHPRAFKGRHYWSLSWIPAELRAEGLETDDLTLLPAWKRLALGRVMAVPSGVNQLPSNEAAMLATATWLAARRDLSLLSVWSPTFALTLLRLLAEHREDIAGTLRAGRWELPLPAPREPAQGRLLEAWDGTLSGDVFEALWPDLAVVSAWDSSASSAPAEELRRLLPQAHLQGKGLWATEGVVTFPFRGRNVAALASHVLEFRCLATGRVLPAWSLEEGQEVQPVLSTSGGLLRYPLEDRLKVTGFVERAPCLAFLGRLASTDLTGEKLDSRAVGEVLATLEARHGLRCVTLFAVEAPAPGYCLLAEGPATAGPALAADLEAELGRFHHYRLARELGQLRPARVWACSSAQGLLALRAERLGQPAGAAKPEVLQMWGLTEPPEAFPGARTP